MNRELYMYNVYRWIENMYNIYRWIDNRSIDSLIDGWLDKGFN